MRKSLPLASLSLGVLLIVAPPFLAVADDPSWTLVADKSLSVFGTSSDLVKIAAILTGGLLAAWAIYLFFQRETPDPPAASPIPANGNHTTDEVYALLNSLSERLDVMNARFDRHLDHHAALSSCVTDR
jgi:hypothetical protein